MNRRSILTEAAHGLLTHSETLRAKFGGRSAAYDGRISGVAEAAAILTAHLTDLPAGDEPMAATIPTPTQLAARRQEAVGPHLDHARAYVIGYMVEAPLFADGQIRVPLSIPGALPMSEAVIRALTSELIAKGWMVTRESWMVTRESPKGEPCLILTPAPGTLT